MNHDTAEKINKAATEEQRDSKNPDHQRVLEELLGPNFQRYIVLQGGTLMHTNIIGQSAPLTRKECQLEEAAQAANFANAEAASWHLLVISAKGIQRLLLRCISAIMYRYHGVRDAMQCDAIHSLPSHLLESPHGVINAAPPSSPAPD